MLVLGTRTKKGDLKPIYYGLAKFQNPFIKSCDSSLVENSKISSYWGGIGLRRLIKFASFNQSPFGEMAMEICTQHVGKKYFYKIELKGARSAYQGI